MAYVGYPEARKKALRTLGWLLLTGGILVGLIFYELKLYLEDRRFWQAAETTNGEIISFNSETVCTFETGHFGSTESRHRDCEIVYLPIFKFIVQGREYRARGTMGWNTKPKSGEPIEVGYSPENPSNAKPTAEDQVTIFGWLLILSVFIGLVLIFFVFILKNLISEIRGFRPHHRPWPFR